MGALREEGSSIDSPNGSPKSRLRSHAEHFVGREEEMALLNLALEAAHAERGGIALLNGGLGTGKTRLAHQFSIHASHNCQVYWGRSYEDCRLPAFWPWVEIVRAYISEHEEDEATTGWDSIKTYTEEFDTAEMRFELGEGASDIAKIVRDVGVAVPDTRPAPALEPSRARFRLMDSIIGFLKKLAERQTTVLVIDNLHEADTPSLQVLRVLAEQLEDDRILVLCTYRQPKSGTTPLFNETLAALYRHPRCHQIAVRPFSFQETRQLISATLGIEPRQELVHALLDRTDGNPLFTVELFRLLCQDGAFEGDRAGKGDILIPGIPEKNTGGCSSTAQQDVRTLYPAIDHLCNSGPRVFLLLSQSNPGYAR